MNEGQGKKQYYTLYYPPQHRSCQGGGGGMDIEMNPAHPTAQLLQGTSMTISSCYSCLPFQNIKYYYSLAGKYFVMEVSSMREDYHR